MPDLNLYYPQAWMEQAQRDYEYALYTRKVSGAMAGYHVGLAVVDFEAFLWVLVVSAMHIQNFRPTVPAWWYTHARKPRP